MKRGMRRELEEVMAAFSPYVEGPSKILLFLFDEWMWSSFFFLARNLLLFLGGQNRLVSRHSQVNREGKEQAMAMGVKYKMSAGMGMYLWLDFMGEMIPQHVQNKATKKGENYVEGDRLGRLPLHLAMEAFHGYGRKVQR